MSESHPAGQRPDQPAACPPQGRHLLLPHDRRESFAVLAGQCLAPALEDGEAVMLLAEPEDSRRVLAALSGHGLDIEAARRADQLDIIDATALLTQATAGHAPQNSHLRTRLRSSVSELASIGRAVHVLCQLGALLWQRRDYGSASAIEAAGNELVATSPVTLWCPYPQPIGRPNELPSTALAQHNGIFIPEAP